MLQVFDENGKFLDQWDFGPRPPMNIHSINMGSDRKLWAADQGSHKLLGYDAEGHFLYSWGTFGACQGCMWGVHGFATDKDGNLYTAEVEQAGCRIRAAQGRQRGVPGRQALDGRLARLCGRRRGSSAGCSCLRGTRIRKCERRPSPLATETTILS